MEWASKERREGSEWEGKSREDGKGSPNSRDLLPGGGRILAPATPRFCCGGECRAYTPPPSAGFQGRGEGMSRQESHSTRADLKPPDSIPTAHHLSPQPSISPRHLFPAQQSRFSSWVTGPGAGKEACLVSPGAPRAGSDGLRVPPSPPLRKAALAPRG